MRLLPYEAFTIHTRESLEAVIDRLQPYIEKPHILSRKNGSRDRILYAGKISETGFEVRRIIHYVNPLLPNIRGCFECSSQGTNIRIRIGLDLWVTVCLLCSFSIWYSITIPIFLSSGKLFRDLVMSMVLLVIHWYFFWYEANRSRRELTAIILGQSLAEEELIFKPASKRPWIITLAAMIILSIGIFVTSFIPSSQQEQSLASVSCVREETQSPYCNFSLLHSLDGHPTASAIALGPDGKILVSGGRDKAIKVWDLQTGALKRTLQSDSGEIESLAIAPDGKTVVSGSGDRMVRIWDMTANQAPKILKGHITQDISHVAISADGQAIASGGYDEIKIWNLATGELKKTILVSADAKIESRTLENYAPYFHVYSISPDGQTALVELGNQLIAWDLETSLQTILPKNGVDRINNARVGWDGKTVVTTSYRQSKTFLRMWDLTTGSLTATKTISSSRDDLPNLALSRDRVIVKTPEGFKLFHLQTAELEAILDNLEPIDDFIISPDGTILIGMTSDSSMKNVKIKVFVRGDR
ncbi:MAG: WD40 repeat domain-containing protein [Spirulina sp.]